MGYYLQASGDFAENEAVASSHGKINTDDELPGKISSWELLSNQKLRRIRNTS